MAIEFTSLELTELKPKVGVIGVGGAGGNAVNTMVHAGVQGVDFIAANTDAQALTQSLAKLKIQLGVEITEGLGAGSHPDIGRAAAEEAIHQIEDALAGLHMVFITAGMGGGTGTGAAPVIAKAAKNQGILTVAVVTKPFTFEGNRRMKLAEDGIYELQPFVDTLIVIPNQNLFRVASKETTFAEAFARADDVLCSGVRGITDLMMEPGLINLDFADIKTIMQNMGTAMMGTGESVGDSRALDAAEMAISNPLLDEMSLASAKGVIINITGGDDLTLFEVDEAASHIRKEVDDNANIIVGSAFSDDLDGKMRVSIVATGVTYLKKSQDVSEPEVESDNDHQRLHFVPAAEVDEAAAIAEQPEPVAMVDDLAMEEGNGFKDEPETEQIEDEADTVTEIVAEETEEDEEELPKTYGRTERFGNEPHQDVFRDSIGFAEREQEPPLATPSSEAETDQKTSLFKRLTTGIKGVFGAGEEIERNEPSMSEFGADEEDAAKILNFEGRDEEMSEDFEIADEGMEDVMENEEDQLSIPSFLRKQA